MLLYAVIIVLLIIVIYMRHAPSRFVEGMWYADPEFCKAADISNMYLLIGRGTGYTTHNCYLTIADAAGTSGEHFDLGYVGPMCSRASITGSEVFPDTASIELDIDNGKLMIKDDETVYGIFYKDNASTTHIKSIDD